MQFGMPNGMMDGYVYGMGIIHGMGILLGRLEKLFKTEELTIKSTWKK